MKENRRCKLKVSRVFLAMGLIVGTLFGADGFRRGVEGQRPLNLKIQGDFRSAGDHKETTESSSLSFSGDDKMPALSAADSINFSEYELSKDEVSKGLLAVYTDSKPAVESDQDTMVDLAEAKNEYYTLSEEGISLNREAARALNSMMEDYSNETELTDFIVYGTTDTYTEAYSYCPMEFAESKSGYCVDLALNAGGSVLTYDGYDTEGWVVDNCWRYGFIVRYPQGKKDKTGNEYCPWHLRYVGDINAAIMKQKDMCLEEYVDFLEKYTFESPYSFSFNDAAYQIYTVSGDNGAFKTYVPNVGDYEISGDNNNSFIITALKN